MGQYIRELFISIGKQLRRGKLQSKKETMGEYDNHPSEPWTFPGLADHVQGELPGSLTESSCQESIECSAKCLLLCQDYGPYRESLVD